MKQIIEFEGEEELKIFLSFTVVGSSFAYLHLSHELTGLIDSGQIHNISRACEILKDIGIADGGIKLTEVSHAASKRWADLMGAELY